MSEEEVFLNALGMESHRTDEFILYALTKKDRIKEATDFRAAFDKIAAAGLETEMETLLTAAKALGYDEGRDAEAEMNAGPER